MVGIAIALYDEAYELIKTLQFEKATGFRHYKGKLCGKDVSLFLTKPAIGSKATLRSWLVSQNFSHVILSGFCGSLTEKLKLGEGYFFEKIIQEQQRPRQRKTQKQKAKLNQKSLVYTLAYSNENLRLFSTVSAYCVRQPVFSLEDKENIFLNHAAETVDMESIPFLKEFYFLYKNERHKDEQRSLPSPLILKFVGDDLSDEKLMLKEKYFRAFFREKKITTKIKIVLKTGVIFSILLYRRKRFLQKQLKKGLCKFIKGSLENI